MRSLLGTFGEAFGEPDTYVGHQPSEPYLERLLGDDSFIALAALSGAGVVGGLAAYELRKFEQERSEIYIYDLAVAESHRRRGIASALIAQLQAVAAARDAYVIFVQAAPGRRTGDRAVHQARYPRGRAALRYPAGSQPRGHHA
jgi:aminoglycoside 3-N-acetyltransferase I